MSSRTSAALTETDCPALQLLARGKVRDIYAVPGHDDALLFVATDRVSAFDVIMKNGIPNKGKLLTSLSLFFFNYLANHPDTKHIPNHVITSDLDHMPTLVHQYRDQLEGRSIWVRKATILPVEAIVRGYITGALSLCCPRNSRKNSRLPLARLCVVRVPKVGHHARYQTRRGHERVDPVRPAALYPVDKGRSRRQGHQHPPRRSRVLPFLLLAARCVKHPG